MKNKKNRQENKKNRKTKEKEGDKGKGSRKQQLSTFNFKKEKNSQFDRP